ncbi:MAG TPA: hypothetical protein VGL19_15620, partial [Polyangiaceae bacterium]
MSHTLRSSQSSPLSAAACSSSVAERAVRRAWFYSLACAGVLLAVIGCGTGSDSPDPNADGTAGAPVIPGGGSGNSNNAAGASGKGSTSGGAQNGSAGASGGTSSHGGAAGTGPVGTAGTTGSTAGSGAGGAISNEPNAVGTTAPFGSPTLSNGRGAIEPYTEYEAEAGTLSGATLLGPTRTGNSVNDVAAEASNRQAVRLAKTGDSVTIKSLNASNSIVVRYSVPDNGLDYHGTLSLYVN